MLTMKRFISYAADWIVIEGLTFSQLKLNDFFFNHLLKYKETSSLPVSFVGGIAYGFKDVIVDLCEIYKFEPGKIIRNPMEGLIDFHS